MDDVKNEIVIQALNEFPDAPTMTLAKKLYKEYPEQFTALENVRSMIRYRRGNKGERDRKTAKHLEKMVRQDLKWNYLKV